MLCLEVVRTRESSTHSAGQGSRGGRSKPRDQQGPLTRQASGRRREPTLWPPPSSRSLLTSARESMGRRSKSTELEAAVLRIVEKRARR